MFYDIMFMFGLSLYCFAAGVLFEKNMNGEFDNEYGRDQKIV